MVSEVVSQPFAGAPTDGEVPSVASAGAEVVPIKEAPPTIHSENALALQSLLQQLLQNKDLVLVDKCDASYNNNNNINNIKKKKTVNPGPLGLLGFGMTTILLNFHNAGAFPLGTVIPAMGLCMGGALQILAGLFEYINGNPFPATAFLCYGTFWISLCAVWMLPQEEHPHLQTSSKIFVGLYLLLWDIFTIIMTIITYCKSHLMMRLLFSTLVVLFTLLSAGNLSENETVLKIAGYDGIVCGSIALYIAFAEIFEDNLGKSILPVFPMK